MWIADLEATHDKRTAHEYDLVATKWADRWQTLGEMTTAALGDYQRERLREVARETVRKNLVQIRTFFAWCVEQGFLEEAPAVPKIPRRATGKPKIKRTPRVPLSPAQVARWLAKLPELSTDQSGRERYRVRDWAIVAYETALRPATINKLSVPDHWKPGSKSLTISADIDKARKARTVPLSAKAVDALRRSAHGDGVIFGVHELDVYFASVGKKVLRRRVLRYDLKHSRITTMFRQGCDLMGISHLTGVDAATLSKHYAHASQDAAKAALRRVG